MTHIWVRVRVQRKKLWPVFAQRLWACGDMAYPYDALVIVALSIVTTLISEGILQVWAYSTPGLKMLEQVVESSGKKIDRLKQAPAITTDKKKSKVRKARIPPGHTLSSFPGNLYTCTNTVNCILHHDLWILLAFWVKYVSKCIILLLQAERVEGHLKKEATKELSILGFKKAVIVS